MKIHPTASRRWQEMAAKCLAQPVESDNLIFERDLDMATRRLNTAILACARAKVEADERAKP